MLDWSGIAPKDYFTWMLEVAPALIGLSLLVYTRNNYDKPGHFMQGFVPAMVTREILIRKSVVTTAVWRNFFIVCFCLAFSVFYELREWWVAIVIGPGSDAFLGTQGYQWGTQSDMAMALLGAVAALLFLGRIHDRQLRQVRLTKRGY